MVSLGMFVAFGVILPWSVIAVLCWLLHQILVQNGRILKRLDLLEEQMDLAGFPGAEGVLPEEGLPLGSVAPPFELPDLKGDRVSLEQFRGQRVLLIFFSPKCSYCLQMAPQLSALPVDSSNGRPAPLVITTGDLEENLKIVREHGIRCPVLRQEEWEISQLYHAAGTPVGYLMDEEGKIASPLAIGAPNLLALSNHEAGTNGKHREPQEDAGNRSRGIRGKNKHSLAESHINRDGLKIGTRAPQFRLTSIDNREIALKDHLGKPVLLVFSDPKCIPCNQLAADLERFHRQTLELQFLMISRGDAEVNRQIMKEHKLTFPVLLQRQWEISRLYAKFNTPVAYFIDESGVIADDVAEGRDSVLALVSKAVRQVARKGGDTYEV